MKVNDSLFVTEYDKRGGHGPITLPEYASLSLTDIERRFGPRDHSFTLVGIDIDKTPDHAPRLWFPDSGITPGDPEERSKQVIIRLGPGALANPVRARWQLAHECFHLLDPWNPKVDGRPTNWLEEGLAAWYQNHRVPEAEWHERSYAVAEDLMRPLMEEFPDAVKRIRQERGLRISEITHGVLRTYCPGFSDDTLQKLCQPFQ